MYWVFFVFVFEKELKVVLVGGENLEGFWGGKGINLIIFNLNILPNIFKLKKTV